jgi:serine/threonine protein kinase
MDSNTRLGNDRYEVRGVLGEGAQGLTYDAVETKSGRSVAIKRFDVRGAKSWKDVELAEREARVLASIDHPMVPRYIEHFEDEGSLYLVMAKVEGETLEALRQRGPLPEEEVRRFLSCADRALTYLHGRSSPVVHRDIKPRNVVRRADGSYVLVDFGAVSELLARRAGSTVIGTIGYMAPEQLQGRAMPSTDVYAVGATALAALTGVEPDALPHRGLRVDVRGALEGRVSPDMIASLEQMLEPDPDKRPSSLAAVLDGVHSGGASRARRSSAPPSASPPRRARMIAAPPTTQPDLAREDALVKSIRNLLWLLWALGWVIVPLVLSQLHMPRLIPTVMFVALAGLFVITWHKGALMRPMIRRFSGRHPAAEGTPKSAGATPRAGVEPGGAKVRIEQQVRVHATELDESQALGQTEVDRRDTVNEPDRTGRRSR